MTRDILNKLDIQRLNSLPAGAKVRLVPYQSSPIRYRAIASVRGPLVVINNQIDAPRVWLASARKLFPQLSYQEVV